MSNVAKVSIVWRITPQDDRSEAVDPVVCTFHVMNREDAEPFSESDLLVMTNDVYEWWRFDFDDVSPGTYQAGRIGYHESVELYKVEARVIEPAEAHELADLRGPYPGNLPDREFIQGPQTARLLTLTTDLDSRRGRGRMYLPPREADFADQTGWIGDENALRIAREGAHLAARIARHPAPQTFWRLCVYSRVNGDPRAVTGFRGADHSVTQRRRAAPRAYKRVGLDGVEF
jgi:hypothetical protein